MAGFLKRVALCVFFLYVLHVFAVWASDSFDKEDGNRVKMLACMPNNLFYSIPLNFQGKEWQEYANPAYVSNGVRLFHSLPLIEGNITILKNIWVFENGRTVCQKYFDKAHTDALVTMSTVVAEFSENFLREIKSKL